MLSRLEANDNMASALITKMQEIIDYNKDTGILIAFEQANERLHFFSKNGPQINRISELGEAANQFIYNAPRHYQNGTFMSPHTLQNVEHTYLLFENVNVDLQGALGSQTQQLQQQQWNNFWEKQIDDYPDLKGQLITVQQDILAAYRSKTINYCVFKPHDRSTQRDELQIQHFLEELNQTMRSGLSAYEAYVVLSRDEETLNILPQKPAKLNNQQAPRHK